MIKRSVIVILCSALIIFLNTQLCLGGDEFIRTLYRQSILYPERFTKYVDDHREAFDEHFYECLDSLHAKYYHASWVQLERCRRIKGEVNVEHVFRNCIDGDIGVHLAFWLSNVREVISGTKSWEDTEFGYSFTSLKMVTLFFVKDPEFWAEMNQPRFISIRPLLRCE